MSRGRPWYRHYTKDFLLGTMSLSLEQRGAYIICLDLMYDRGGPIPDDERWIARACNCSMQRWRKIKTELIAVGKLKTHPDGTLSNGRATYEIHLAREESEDAADRGRKGGRPPKTDTQAKTHQQSWEKVEENPPTKSQLSPGVFEEENCENNDLTKAYQSQSQSQNQKKEEEELPLPPRDAPPKRKAKPPDLAIFAQLAEAERTHKSELTECDQVVDAWNVMARATGLPQARRKLTDDRRKRLRARIADYGLETLISAVDQIRDRPFLLGDNDWNWKADFAWLLQQDAANKILEGRYAAREKKLTGAAGIMQKLRKGTLWNDDYGEDDVTISRLPSMEDTHGD